MLGRNSLAESLALLPDSEREKLLAEAPERQLRELLYDWRFWARPSQILPGTTGAELKRNDWLIWLVLAGRGFGKTRIGAESVREWAEDPNERILMIAPTAADVREVMIEGESGLKSCYPPWNQPFYEPTKHLVTFPSGAIGFTRAAEEPERLRGPQFTKFWADELCAWRQPAEAWAQIMFGFRLPQTRIQGLVTTTPKPIDTLLEIVRDADTIVTRGSSYENRANISPTYYEKVIRPYEGTRLGRQEIHAEILEDVPGALWTARLIDATRIAAAEVRWDLLVRIVIGIDPAVTAKEDSDETGIVLAALTPTGHVLILDDLSCRESPLGWGKVAAAAYFARRADRVVGEVNNGGDLVEANLRAVAPNIAFRAVRASRGKAVRAEPVAALYEQGRVHHVGYFQKLEAQMCSFVPGIVARESPDRMDALVWAVTELVLDQQVDRQVFLRELEQISPI